MLEMHSRRNQLLEYPARLFFGTEIVSLFSDPAGFFRAGLVFAIWQSRKMQPVVKGMVQVHSVTYRIVRVRSGHYDVVRLLDDVRIGSFTIGARRETLIEGESPEVIREVARAALQGGRTTWAPRRLTA